MRLCGSGISGVIRFGFCMSSVLLTSWVISLHVDSYYAAANVDLNGGEESDELHENPTQLTHCYGGRRKYVLNFALFFYRKYRSSFLGYSPANTGTSIE